MKNALGREFPDEIDGRKLKPYSGPFSFRPEGRRYSPPLKAVFPDESKVLGSIREAIKKTGIEDGSTISFHHHLRNGDAVVNMVVDEIAKMGIKNITLAPTALFPVHEPIIEHIKNGVVTSIHGSLNGPIGAFVSEGGKLKESVILRSHGGRARAIASGDLHIDVAFIAASAADDYGNCNGSFGDSAFGALGFGVADARHADKVVVVTDNIVPYPCSPISISQTLVDYVVNVPSIGDPGGIKTGTMQITKSPSRLMMAKNVVKFFAEAGILKDGFSFQAGAGGTSLAVTKFLHEYMREKGIVGSFVMGGITGFVVDMLEDGTINKILDAQSFDLKAAESMRKNMNHVEVSHIDFGDMHTGGCIVNRQHACFLGATEIDLDFNAPSWHRRSPGCGCGLRHNGSACPASQGKDTRHKKGGDNGFHTRRYGGRGRYGEGDSHKSGAGGFDGKREEHEHRGHRGTLQEGQGYGGRAQKTEAGERHHCGYRVQGRHRSRYRKKRERMVTFAGDVLPRTSGGAGEVVGVAGVLEGGIA